MKLPRFKLPFGARALLFVLGLGSAFLPFNAIRSGYFHQGNHGRDPYDITQSQEPVIFWALVAVFSLLSAGIFYVVFANKRSDA